MFGLGLKTAAASLGRYWSVTSRPLGADTELFIEFNLEDYRKATGAKGFEWGVEIEERSGDQKAP